MTLEQGPKPQTYLFKLGNVTAMPCIAWHAQGFDSYRSVGGRLGGRKTQSKIGRSAHS